ncbi:amino acid ABC transporter substrate-binding protein [Parendozoicomonas haliclonae]|uniref:Putative amino-acid-binding protein YxeM n=1 Tax=Parendozoicomonas haliclonae TaxID=1960125 RepID=A0A1X7ANG7_9GAMM|nr:amino acid ABC transporter substrate-binding protein [Parendozoicomonas haliclonae]SMA49815.1 putative amino-acid-binding protein YxeM precursor [Parendozoicomonas haliclonae]
MLRRMSRVALSVVLAGALAACSQQESSSATAQTENAPAAQEGVKVGMSGSYYPFTFVEQGELQGFEVDIWNELGKRLDRPVEFVTAPFSGLFGMLESQRVDTISNQITVTEARLEKYNFATPYVYDGAQITVNNQTMDIHSLEDLKGKTVAVNLGTNFENLIRAFDSEGQITVKTYDTGIEHEVALGRVDAFIMDRLSAAELVKKSGLPLKPAGQPFEVITNAMPFLKTEDADALRIEVDAALQAMREDGTLANISQKWFGTDVTRN